MPVNMDPAKRRKTQPPKSEKDLSTPKQEPSIPTKPTQFGEETEEDRMKELADAEKRNLWEATEVIDMDKF